MQNSLATVVNKVKVHNMKGSASHSTVAIVLEPRPPRQHAAKDEMAWISDTEDDDSHPQASSSKTEIINGLSHS